MPGSQVQLGPGCAKRLHFYSIHSNTRHAINQLLTIRVWFMQCARILYKKTK